MKEKTQEKGNKEQDMGCTYNTIKSKVHKFKDGKKFIEVARKKAIPKNGDPQTEFVAISTGSVIRDQETGKEKMMYRKSMSLPTEKEALAFVARTIAEV